MGAETSDADPTTRTLGLYLSFVRIEASIRVIENGAKLFFCQQSANSSEERTNRSFVDSSLTNREVFSFTEC